MTRVLAMLAAIAVMTGFTARDPAEAAYPDHPITLIVPLPPGGTNDILARSVADKMSDLLGQRVVVECHNAGGSGTVGTRQFTHAKPDGYTILLGYTSTLATGPSLYKNVGYDPLKDFSPIGLIASSPALLLVNKNLPIHNVHELIALMKSSKEPYQVGTPGIGTVNYLASVMFAQQAGVKVEQIPEKGSAALINDLMGGFVKVGFNPVVVSRAAIDGGYIRALAVTSKKHSTLMSQLPTLAEAGLPGFDATLNYGLLAPADTPKPIIERLNGALRAALADPAVRKRIIQEGAEPEPTTPEEQAALIQAEVKKWSVLIHQIGLKIN